MYLFVLLLGPTIMIFLGLQLFSSVPITFLLFYGWLLLVPLLNVLISKGLQARDAFRHFGLVVLRKNALIGISSGILFFLLILVAGSFFHPYLFDRSGLLQLLERWNFSGRFVMWLVLILMLINPILEEVYWRGYIHHKLEKQRPGTVILLTAFFYSLYHFLSVIPLFAWPFNVMMVIPVFLAGLIWGSIRHRYSSVLGSIISHVLADTGIMAVYLLYLA